MELNIFTVLVLIASGIFVGFVNTFAGGGTIVSTTVLMAFGMPITTALGTNRICILMQNFTSSYQFRKQKLLDPKHGLRLFVPLGIGALIGATLLNITPEPIITLLFTLGGLFSMVMVFAKKSVMERPNDHIEKDMSPKEKIAMFFIGIYAGSVYVGVGYMILAVFIMGMGYDIIRANALKGFMALLLSPVSIIPFIISGNINYTFGLVHGVGNIIGAYIASRKATAIGVKYIRWIMIIMILISLAHTFYSQGTLDQIKELFR